MFTYLVYYLLGIIVIPGILLGVYAQVKLNRVYNEYAAIPNSAGWNAHDVARKVLDTAGLQNIELKNIKGSLTDHYHPKKKYIGLSRDVYDSDSIASLGIALHEVGHALQHQQHYSLFWLRQIMVPITNIASTLLWPLVIIGLLLGFGTAEGGLFADICVYSGLIFFGSSVLINLITLPVEFDASRRAMQLLENGVFLNPIELDGARKVLSAAALTYVAALVVSILEFLRFLIVVMLSRE